MSLAVGAFLAACAGPRPDEVGITTGLKLMEFREAKHFAALYYPYAMMATLAYTDREALNGNWCPDRRRLLPPSKRPLGKDSNLLPGDMFDALTGLGWACEFGLYEPKDCPKNNPDCNPVGGLELHVWRKGRGACQEVVIAFRGTDSEWGDWQSNLRWFRRWFREFDQYEQVQLHIDRIIEKIEKKGCRQVPMITVGHSLGGGLAQQAVYMNQKIRYAYAFDPSPVTGFSDIALDIREKNKLDRGVDRIYEIGEVLAAPRFILGGFNPPTFCDPQIRIVRFNMVLGQSAFRQHSIATLTTNLDREARKPGANPKLAEGFRDARTCTFWEPTPRT